MRERGMGIVEIRHRSFELGHPLGRTTIYRVMGGEMPRFPTQKVIAQALSTPDEKITAAQLFGTQPLPRWAQDTVYGVAA